MPISAASVLGSSRVVFGLFAKKKQLASFCPLLVTAQSDRNVMAAGTTSGCF